jgi:hypothetical protein
MGKYEPLTQFLRKQAADEIPMTFAQLERILGTKLPPKAQRYRAWWSNNPSNNVLTKAWLEAGFRSEKVDLEARKLMFRRIKPSRPPQADAPSATKRVSKRHPLIGALKGLMWIAPGTDLTQPADPEWGDRAWGKELP